MKKILIVLAAMSLFAGVTHAQATKFDNIPESVTLFKKVKVFNDKEDKLH